MKLLTSSQNAPEKLGSQTYVFIAMELFRGGRPPPASPPVPTYGRKNYFMPARYVRKIESKFHINTLHTYINTPPIHNSFTTKH